MLINKIELKNFRNHRESAFEFEKGINLILGENGSGKTSILDAIGYALFNMKLRSDVNETLTINESSGSVKITFTGNDDIRYAVTRKFPSGSVSLSVEGAKTNITGVSEVYTKINSLIGNNTENPALFENVIVASQNKFTSIFDAKPSERETVFNSVFGTEIYRQMYRGLLKESCDIYDKRLIFAEGDLGSKLSQLKNSTELQNMRIAAEKDYSASQKIFIKSEKKIEENDKALRHFESLKTRKEKLLIEINGIGLQLEDKKVSIEAIESDLKKAAEAALIESELKPKHDEFGKIKIEQLSVNKELVLLEKIEKELISNIGEIAKIEKDKAIAEGDIKALKQQILSDKTSAVEFQTLMQSLSVSIDSLEKEKVLFGEELATLIKRKTAFDDLYKNYKDSITHGSNAALLAAKAEESGQQEESIIAEISEFKSKSKELEVLKTNRDSLNAEITVNQTLLSGLKEAQHELSNQLCPFLKEQCRNIESAGSMSGFFDPKINEIELKLSQLKKDNAKYNDLDDLIKKYSDSISKKNEQLAAIGKSRNDALKYRKDESEYKQKAAEYALAISKLFAGKNGKDALLISEENYDAASSEMQSGESFLKTKLSGITESLKEKLVEFKKKENDLKNISGIIENTEKKKIEIEKRIIDLDDDRKKRNETVKICEEKISPLAGLKKLNTEFSLKLNELEPFDQQYRSAAQSAARTVEFQDRLKAEKSGFEILTKKQQVLRADHDSIVYNAQDHNNLTALCIELKSELKEQNILMINSKSAFDAALKLEESNNLLARELEDKKEQIGNLKRKKEIAETFRENIKLLGPYISERRTKMIANAATENFQRMTGRSERILWENNVEQYLVSIASGSGKRRFNMLSGGEQVAVALSIRSALASEMTDCRFAIFDEPTINLDAEKREALSVSLYDMLKNLEQALVVTHDSTFREMATKVIEL